MILRNLFESIMRRYFQYLVILLFCNAFLIQRAESETRYSFIVSADPQYVAEKSPQPKKLDPFSDQANSRFVNLMKSFAGTEIPDSSGGGVVDDKILGILVAGDLIDSADKNGGDYPAMQRFEWARYKSDYGLNGESGKIPFPVYELHGNHDGPQGDTFIIKEIIERNRARAGVVNRSKNGLHYSWDWGPLHLVNLGMFVGGGEARREGHHYAPRGSLEFLQADLAKHVADSGRPVIISFHLHPNSSEYDWPKEDLAAFMNTIRKHNVVALFHGHTHGSPSRKLQWNGTQFGKKLPRGIDVFNCDDSGAAKTDRKNPGKAVGIKHGFLYVELIDRDGDAKDQFIVRSVATDDNWATYRWDRIWEKSAKIPSGAAKPKGSE